MSEEQTSTSENKLSTWLPGLAWLLAGGLLIIAALLVFQRFSPVADASTVPTPIPFYGQPAVTAMRPGAFDNQRVISSIERSAYPETIIPERARVVVLSYEVVFGDSLFGIANDFDITPETLLWANKAVLADNPDTLEPGMILQVPPINGVLHQWQPGDSFDSVADDLFSTSQKIIDWVGNGLDLSNPHVPTGEIGRAHV